MCSNNRENIFGKISVGADGCRPDNNTKIKLNEFGLIVDGDLTGGQPSAPTGQTLSSFVSGFKSMVTRRINILRSTPKKPVWQRSFYDHVIRSKRSLSAIREYISNNPINWKQDIDNLINL